MAPFARIARLLSNRAAAKSLPAGPVIVASMIRRETVVAGVWLLAVAVGPACHVVVQTETTRPVAIERVPQLDAAIARRATVIWTDAGRLRFVEPLDCPTDELAGQRATIEIVTRPNLATFTVGVIAAAVGSVLATSGLLSSNPSSSGATYAGLAGLAIGAPLAIGPWIGNRTELRSSGGGELRALHRLGPRQPCGERPLTTQAATLAISGLEIYGAVDGNGVFAVSPYEWIDAYSVGAAATAAVTATAVVGGTTRTIEAVLDADGLAKHAAAYLAHAPFDASVETLKLVPGISAGTLRVSLTDTSAGPAVRVVLALRNDGPGDAWGLRGQIIAPQAPAIDGRMIYVGRLARGATVASELVIPVAPPAAATLRGAPVELSVELRDAHGTAPTMPVRFRGALASEPAQ
jgi:hypothetical protein